MKNLDQGSGSFLLCGSSVFAGGYIILIYTNSWNSSAILYFFNAVFPEALSVFVVAFYKSCRFAGSFDSAAAASFFSLQAAKSTAATTIHGSFVFIVTSGNETAARGEPCAATDPAKESCGRGLSYVSVRIEGISGSTGGTIRAFYPTSPALPMERGTELTSSGPPATSPCDESF